MTLALFIVFSRVGVFPIDCCRRHQLFHPVSLPQRSFQWLLAACAASTSTFSCRNFPTIPCSALWRSGHRHPAFLRWAARCPNPSSNLASCLSSPLLLPQKVAALVFGRRKYTKRPASPPDSFGLLCGIRHPQHEVAILGDRLSPGQSALLTPPPP